MPDSVNQILTRLSPGKFDATRSANFDIEAARGHLESSFIGERLLNVNPDDRTADFAFATDQPMEHWFGMLELDVSKKAVNLDRVEQGLCPFLVNHNRDDMVGVVVPGSVELGPVIRGTVKFSASERGEEIFQDVKDEIRNGTSIGFLIEDLQLLNEKETRKGAIPMYRATKWTMLENSSAPIPMDTGCGAGRSFEKLSPNPQERALSTNTENNMTDAEIAAATAAEAQRTATPAPVVDTRSAERITAERTHDIIAFAETLGGASGADLARTMVAASADVTIGDVRTALNEQRIAAAANHSRPGALNPADQALEQGGVRLARTLPRFGTLRNFTGDNGAERAYRFGQWFLAIRGVKSAMDFCDKEGITRAMSEGVNESGGFLVPEEFGNDLIDLREQYGVLRRCAKMVPMSSDTRSDPRRDGGLNAYFEGEGDAITASDMSWGRVSLTAKKLAVLARYSNEWSEDSTINNADILAGEMAYAFAQKEDNCGFIGDGTSTYGGMQGVCTKIKGLSGTIANIAGLVVATGTGYGTNYASAVLTDFEAVVGKLPVYADTANAKWFMHKSFYWNVAKKLELAAGGVTAGEIATAKQRTFLGYDVEIVQVMPKTSAVSQVCALLGDMSLAASFGSRRDTTIAISEHSRFANDQLEIRGTERFDINVHDLGNASATAGLRVEGPIVGLITAAS